jgi:cytochrome c oxidase cbb3-type subunit 4
MDIDVFRGAMTAILMTLFVCLVLWAYSRGRHDEFEAAAKLPLEDDRAPDNDTGEPAN